MNNLVDCHDRTAEFFSIVQQIQRAPSHQPPLPNRVHRNGDSFSSSDAASLKQQSQFAQAAQHIGRSIHMVTERLEKLGKLVKQRSLFNDPASEINELTYGIKTDLSTLSTELEMLHNGVASSSSNNEALSVQATRNSSAIADNLKQQLMSTTKSFQDVLHVRTSNLKAQNQARTQFEASGRSSSSSSRRRDNNALSFHASKRGGAAGANPFGQLMSAATAASLVHQQDTESTSHDDEEPSFMTPGAGSGSFLMQAQDQTDEYIASRAQAVEDIEGTVVQLGQMYQNLVHIVGMQEAITIR